MVGFGRTEVSVRLDCVVVCALSFGHGPRGQGFEGFSKALDFHDFWEFKNAKNHENQPLAKPLRNPVPWDHAQTIERKNLYHPTEWKPLYDQPRP